MGEVRRIALAFDLDAAAGSRVCGYRSVHELAQAFREAEYLTPLMYRRIYRPRREPPAARPVQVVFIGPDGNEES